MQQQLQSDNFKSAARLTCIFLALLSLSCVAFAQGPDNGYQIGLPQHGEFSGDGFEHVQLNNNNLHIDLPLWSTAGRGLSGGFKYVYDSKGWGFAEHCVHFTGDCHDRVVPTPGGPGQALANNLILNLVGFQSYRISAIHQSWVCNGTGITVLLYSYGVTTPDGTSHHFAPDPVEAGPESAYCYPHPTTLYADDGSGWRLNINQSTGTVYAVGKDGTVVSGNIDAFNIEDTNGNEVSGGLSSGETDTLGRTISTDGSYYDSSGVLRTIPVVHQTLAVQSHLCSFSTADTCSEYAGGWSAPQIITLPNGKTYTFSYDQGSPTHPYYGQPLSVTLPTGSQITWGWSGEDQSGPTLVSRRLSGDPAPWLYSGNKVTDPAGNDMVYTCGWYQPPYYIGDSPVDFLCYIIAEMYYQGSSTTGTLIKTVQTDYWTINEPAILPIHQTTTWNPQNQVSRTETDYDSWVASSSNNVTYYGTGGNVIEKREYGYGTGTWGSLVRTTDAGYLHLSNSTYLGLNILNKVTSHKVYAGSSGSGTLTAQTLNTYDGVAIPPGGNTSANPAPNHDYTNFPASYNLRGNLTQVSKGLKSGSTWTWLNTNYTYNDLGQLLTSTDPLNHTTTSDYTDNWVSISNPQCVTSAHSYAFATTITDPLGHRLKHQYYSCTSLVGSDQNENDIQAARLGTTYTYDLMSRLLAKSLPDGGSVTNTFNDTALPYSVTQSTLVDPNYSLSMVNTSVFDGLGRVQQVQKHDPDCLAGLIKVDNTYGYGIQGRTTQVSTPYCNSAGGSYGLTATTNFEALDRPVSVQQSDGSTGTTTYAGNCQTSTDERGKSRKSCFDALGRLTQVFEDPAGLNYETDYGYDVLDNLTSVTQKDGATSTQWRNRSFTYDSLSRLTCAANPEITSGLSTANPASCPATYTETYTSGTVGYAYDADSELLTRTAPAPNQTGAATVTTTYSYNPDHQLTGIIYSDGTTPNVKYGYNGTALTGCSTTPPSLTDSNPVHTRTSMCDGSGATSWAHDEMGRVLTEKRTIVGSSSLTNTIGYSYYKDGELKVLTYPNSNRQMTYAVNGSGGYTAGRPLSAVDTTNSINFATAATYTPHGAVASLTIGASVTAAETYNSRMQPLQVYYTVGAISSNTLTQLQQAACPTITASIMSRSYDFGQAGSSNNGTVQSITNCRDNNRTQNFFYDSLNRITQAYTTGNSPLSTSWGEILTIDAWGNLTNKSPVSGKTNTEPLNVAPASIKNQLNGLCNDSTGSLVLNTSCPIGTFTPTYSYDAENRLIATGGVNYTYDGDGKRVKKSNGMLYWTGVGSDALLETDLSGNPTAEYVFFNGRRIARIDRPANTVEYYYADHLGSTDVVTTATGSIVKESDYYPYGGEIQVVTGDSNRYKFTGKERDSESGLDNFGARYDSSSLGRFMTPDWAARPTAVPYAVFGDPQSLNLYGYVRNDPVSRADLDGHGTELDALSHRDLFYGDGGIFQWGMGMPISELPSRSNAQVKELRDYLAGQSIKAQQKQPAQKQAKPAGLVAIKVEVMNTGKAYGIKLRVTYHIVDQKGNAVTGDGTKMEPQERVSGQVNGQPLQMSIGTGWGDIGPSGEKGTSKYADAKGQFVDAPLGITGDRPFTSTSNQEIGIKMGKETFPVRDNQIGIVSNSPGHGQFSNQVGWVGGDLNAEH